MQPKSPADVVSMGEPQVSQTRALLLMAGIAISSCNHCLAEIAQLFIHSWHRLLSVEPASILLAESTGETPVSPTGWKPVLRLQQITRGFSVLRRIAMVISSLCDHCLAEIAQLFIHVTRIDDRATDFFPQNRPISRTQ